MGDARFQDVNEELVSPIPPPGMLPKVIVPVLVFRYTVTFSIPTVLSPMRARELVIAGTWYMPGDGLVMLLVSAPTVQENWTVFGVGPVPPPFAVTYPVSV
jgi:hypothetical protein